MLPGLDHTKRSLKALSMVETGSFFSTAAGHGEGADGESENPGTLNRGLRSTSYRKACVSVEDSEVPSMDPKAHRFSQPVIKWLDEDKIASPVSLTSPETAKPTSPGTPKLASPRILKLASLGKEKPTNTGKNKVGATNKQSNKSI